jgi:hypothetical protein
MREIALARIVVCLFAGLAAACGGGSYGGDGGNRPPATLSIAVEPTTITLGDSATLTWSSNARNCSASGAWAGNKTASGSETVSPASAGTFTYSLVCSGGRYGQSNQGSATLTVNPAQAAGLWIGEGCCLDSASFAVAGMTNESGEYRFLALGTHYVGKAGEVPASYTTSDSSLAGRRAADPHAFRLLEISPRVSVREGVARSIEFLVPYDRGFERAAAPEGHYTTHLASGYTLTVSIDAGGRLTGIDTNGCRLGGRARARHVARNAFDVTLEVAACGESDGRYAGDAALLFDGGDRAAGLFLSASNEEAAIGWRLGR